MVRHRQRHAGPHARVRVLARRRAVRAVQHARDALASSPASTRSASARSTSPATSTRRRPTRTWEVVPAPIADDHVRPEPAGSCPASRARPCRAPRSRRSFTFTADQPDATFECSVDGSDFVPCTSPYLAFAVDRRRPRVPGPRRERAHDHRRRADRPGPGDELRVARAARARLDAAQHRDHGRPATRRRSTRSPSSSSPAATTARRPTLLTFECSLDGQPYTGCSSPEEYSDLLHGDARAARARDRPRGQRRHHARALHVERRPAAGRDDPHRARTRSSRARARRSRGRRPCPAPPTSAGSTARSSTSDCTSPVTLLRPGRRRPPVRRPRDVAARARRRWSGRSGSGRSATPRRRSRPSTPGRTSRRPRTRAPSSPSRASKPNSTFMCSLDGREPEPCTSPLVFPRLHAGQHRLEVTAFSPRILDQQGVPIEPDYDEIPAIYEWEIIDTEAPRRVDRLGPARHDDQHDRGVRPQRRRPDGRARVLARRRRLQRVRARGRVHRARARPAHAPGARGRPARQRRPDAGAA